MISCNRFWMAPWVSLLLPLMMGMALTGCGDEAPKVAPPKVPVVPVSHPVARTVTDFVDFTGRTAAVNSVNVAPRATGYLTKITFKEGAELKIGEVLFQIDPRPYQAQHDQAVAQVALNQANLKLATTTLARDLSIAKTPGAISQQQLDQDKAAVNEAEAQVQASQALAAIYQLNLEFTEVKAPISGKAGRYFLTVGNLVVQDQTLLTTIVSLDPIYAYFEMDEPTLVQIRKAINEGKIKRPEAGTVPVFLGLQGAEDFPHRGLLDFVNNQVSPTTGSITIRGVFDNPLPPGGARLLSPGMFVRIHLPIGQPHPALLVIDRAIGSDQGLKYVYVLGANDTLEYRRVTLGALQPDGLRVLADGLRAGEQVVVGSLQQIRPGMHVKAEPVPMPTLGAAAAGG